MTPAAEIKLTFIGPNVQSLAKQAKNFLAGLEASGAVNAEEVLDDAIEDTDSLNESPADEDFQGFDEEEETIAPKKGAKAKTPKITDADVQKAAMKHAQVNKGRAKTLEILYKNFRVKSVAELKPEQYAKALKLLAI